MFKEFIPTGRASKYIERYFTISKSKEDAPTSELIIPDGTAGIMFFDKAYLNRAQINPNEGRHKLDKAYIFGQKRMSVFYELEEKEIEAFGAKLKPCTIRQLIGIPASQMTDRFYAIAEVFGDSVQFLLEQLGEAQDVEEKINALDNFLLSLSDERSNPKAELISQILDHIHRSKGDVRIMSLCKKFFITYKTLERLFNQYVGLSPKIYCRITRFNSTLYLRKKEPEASLTQIAYSAGYYDQMHFINDMRLFTNMTPRQFFNRDLHSIERAQRSFCASRWE